MRNSDRICSRSRITHYAHDHTLAALPFQKIYFVDRNRLAIAEHCYDYSESDGGLGSGDNDDEYRKYRPGERIHRKSFCAEHFFVQLEIPRERDQVEIDGVQNQLDGHEDDDNVAARQ